MKGIEFPTSPVAGAYELADGYAHWLLPHWVHFWQLVFVQALRSMGAPAAIPPCIFDCALEDGETPRGHPGNAHDDYDDLDLGYAMTGNPKGDFAIGPVRWVKVSRDQTWPQLASAPTLLDTRYQAAIFAHAAILDREFGGLIQTAAVDPMAEAVLEEAIAANDLREETKRTARNLINSSKDVSWLYWHQHHYHVRHLIRRDGPALATEFRTRLAALLTPDVTPHPNGPPLSLEERVLRLERAAGLVTP